VSNADKSKKNPTRQGPSKRAVAESCASPASAERRRVLLGAAVIVVVGILAYLPFMENQFIWDDDFYVTDNHTLKDLAGLRSIWLDPKSTPQYYPLVHTTFWVEYHLWELDPRGYHAVNIMLHLASSILLWRLLASLGVPGAWLAGVIFAVHPVQVESVAWITERKNVLSGLFYLLAAGAYLRFSPPTPEPPARRRWGYYALSFGLLLAALLSKTVTCTLPAALLLVLWWKRRKLDWRDVAALAPMMLIGAAMGLFTAYIEKTHVGATGTEWQLSVGERFIVAGRALWFYVGKLLAPYPLVFIYPRWAINGAIWWQYVFPVSAAAAIVAVLVLRKRIGKGPAVAVLFFAGTLLPALGFINVYPMRYSYVADHFQYLACIGMIALFAAIVWTLRAAASPRGRWIISSLVSLAVATLMLVTMLRAPAYRDVIALWEDVLKTNDCIIAHGNLAGELFKQRQVERAYEHYAAVLRLSPAEAPGQNGVGSALFQMHKPEQALPYLREAVRLKPDNAGYRLNLGTAYQQLNRLEEAAEQYSTAIQLKPTAEAYFKYANILTRMRKLDAAIAALEKSVQMDPSDPTAAGILRQLKQARASGAAPDSTTPAPPPGQ
jgi:tetratricopeptide (TPR) repeat protein